MRGFIKSSVKGFLVIATLMQHSVSIADMIIDLPNPDADIDESMDVSVVPDSVATEYRSNTQLTSVSRKSGGSLYRISLDQPTALNRVSVKVSSSKAKVYKVETIDTTGKKTELMGLRSENVLATGISVSQVIENESLVSVIEILVESYGAESNIEIAAVSTKQVPSLKVALVETAKEAPAAKVEQAKSEGKKNQVVESKEVTSSVKAANLDDRMANYDIPFREGDFAYNLERDNVKVRILGVDRNGKYVIRFLEGPLKEQIGDGWSRKNLMMTWGCSKNLCVGDIVYNKDREGVAVKVIGLSYDGNHYLEFLEGALKGKKGAKWSIDDLTLAKRCGVSHCVNQKFVLVGENRDPSEVAILAVDGVDKYFVQFLTGPIKGKRGGNWDSENLASMRGCSEGMCVGDVVHNTQREYVKVKILAIDKNGKFVIEFLEGALRGKSGAYWSGKNLKKFNY